MHSILKQRGMVHIASGYPFSLKVALELAEIYECVLSKIQRANRVGFNRTRINSQ